MSESLLGVWVQDNYAIGGRKQYEFNADGSYRFTDIAAGQVLQQEEGTFAAEEGSLTLSPTGGSERSVEWVVDKDPYVGDTRLVFEGSDIFYRQ